MSWWGGLANIFKPSRPTGSGLPNRPIPTVTVDHPTQGPTTVPVATRKANRFATGTAAAALPALRTVMAAAVAYTAVYRFCTLFAMEPYLQGMNPSLYYTVSRLVQFWM